MLLQFPGNLVIGGIYTLQIDGITQTVCVINLRKNQVVEIALVHNCYDMVVTGVDLVFNNYIICPWNTTTILNNMSKSTVLHTVVPAEVLDTISEYVLPQDIKEHIDSFYIQEIIKNAKITAKSAGAILNIAMR